MAKEEKKKNYFQPVQNDHFIALPLSISSQTSDNISKNEEKREEAANEKEIQEKNLVVKKSKVKLEYEPPFLFQRSSLRIRELFVGFQEDPLIKERKVKSDCFWKEGLKIELEGVCVEVNWKANELEIEIQVWNCSFLSSLSAFLLFIVGSF